MLEVPEKSRITSVMTGACRSYSALAFDGCPACVDAALDAIAQAGLYVLGQAAPSVAGRGPAGPSVEVSYRLVVCLCDETGVPIGDDQIEAAQTISAVPEDEAWGEEPLLPAEEEPAGGRHGEGSMRLDDFQTILDLVELAPAGKGGMTGSIRGKLFGFERPIGEFDIEVHPGR